MGLDSSSLPYIVAVVHTVDDYCTYDFVESLDLLLLEIDSDKPLSWLM